MQLARKFKFFLSSQQIKYLPMKIIIMESAYTYVHYKYYNNTRFYVYTHKNLVMCTMKQKKMRVSHCHDFFVSVMLTVFFLKLYFTKLMMDNR